MALAGALVRYWPDDQALEFLCAVCRAVGDEDRPKRATSIREARAHLLAGTPFTGWPKLAEIVGEGVVARARDLLGMSEWVDGSAIRGAFDDLPVVVQAASENPTTPGTRTPANDGASGFDFAWGGFEEPLPPLEYTVADFLVKSSVSMLVAPGSSLKSWVAFSMARAVALGRPWLDKYAVHCGRAAILDFESGRYEVRRRMQLLGGAGLQSLGTVSYPNLRLTEPRAWEAMIKLGLTLLIVDSLHACAPELDENDTRIAIPLQLASKFAEATGCTVLFIHHSNKGEHKDKRNKVRGSSALFGACDAIYDFEKLDAPYGTARARMDVLKPGAGLPPKPITLELSDNGLRLYADAGATLASKAREPMDLVPAVRLSLATLGPVSGVKGLAMRLGKREKSVGEALGVLVERGEVLKLPREIRLDSASARRERVVAALTERAIVGERVCSATHLAKLADVGSRDIDALTREGVIAKLPGLGGKAGSYVVLGAGVPQSHENVPPAT